VIAQNCFNFRTYCKCTATDISFYLRSRYGVVISHNVAVQLACGLGAAVRRNVPHYYLGKEPEHDDEDTPDGSTATKFLYKIRTCSRSAKATPNVGDEQQLSTSDASRYSYSYADDEVDEHDSCCSGSDEDDDEDDDEVYLDIVQIVSLLIIPNLVDTRDAMLNLNASPSNNICRRSSNVHGQAKGCNVDGDGGGDGNDNAFELNEDRHNRNNLFAVGASALKSLAIRKSNYNPSISSNEGQQAPIILTIELLKGILQLLSVEHDDFFDDALIERMVDAASNEDSGVAYLNEETLARVLTLDVTEKWQSKNDKMNHLPTTCSCIPTTSFQDAFGCTVSEAQHDPPLCRLLNAANFVNSNAEQKSDGENTNDPDIEAATSSVTDESYACNDQDPKEADKTSSSLSNDDKASASKGTKKQQQLHLVFTAASIDYVADTYRSSIYLVLLWCFYITSVLSYVSIILSTLPTNPHCDAVRTFGCKLMETLWVWLSFAIMLSLAGVIIVVPISMGNQPNSNNWRSLLTSMMMLLIYSVVPFVVFFYHPPQVLNEMKKTYEPLYYYLLIHANFGIGCMLFALQLYHTISPSLHNCFMNSKVVNLDARVMQSLFTPSDVRAEMNVKRAAQHKVDLMLQNACVLHSKNQNNEGTMRNFLIRGESRAHCGGFAWTWRGLWDHSLFSEEGVWIQSRLIVGQVAQVIVAIMFGLLLFFVTTCTARATEKARQDIINDPFSTVSKDWALWLLPQSEMILISSYVGLGISLCTSVVLILLYLPSTVGTILKLRTGVIPTLPCLPWPDCFARCWSDPSSCGSFPSNTCSCNSCSRDTSTCNSCACNCNCSSSYRCSSQGHQ